MKSEPLEEFTAYWDKFPPEETKNCPPDETLAQWAKERDCSKWPTHARTCKHCNEILKLLQTTDELDSKLQAFLRFTRAEEATPEKSGSVLTYLHALLSVNNPRWIGAAVIILAVSSVFLWSFDRYVFYKPTHQAALVSLPKDVAADEIRIAEARLEDLRNSPPRQIADLNEKIKEYNQLVAEVKQTDDQHQLQPEQRGRLKDLLMQSYSELYLSRAELTGSKTSPSKPPQIPEKSPDHDQFASLYANVNRAVSKKNIGSSDKPPTELERAYAVRAASQEISIQSDTPNEVTIWDRVENRPTDERKAVIDGIKVWSNESKVNVNFVFGSGTARITPGAANAFSWSRQ